jgi:hypothetical protein
LSSWARWIGELVEIVASRRLNQDRHVMLGDRSPTFPVDGGSHDCRPTRSLPILDASIDELDEVVRESDRELFAHPTMVSTWDETYGTVDQVRGRPSRWLRQGSNLHYTA